MIFIILSCIAAFFVGWTLGPLLHEKYDMFVKKVQESAKRSEERNKKDNKYYSTLSIPLYNEQAAGKKKDRYFFTITAIFFISLIISLITNSPLFWKITGITVLVMTWKNILSALNPFKEEKKK